MIISSKVILMLLCHITGKTEDLHAIEAYMQTYKQYIEVKRKCQIDFSDDLELYNYLLLVQEEITNKKGTQNG